MTYLENYKKMMIKWLIPKKISCISCLKTIFKYRLRNYIKSNIKEMGKNTNEFFDFKEQFF